MIPNFEMIFFFVLILLKSFSEGEKKNPSYFLGTSLTFKYLQKKIFKIYDTFLNRVLLTGQSQTSLSFLVLCWNKTILQLGFF